MPLAKILVLEGRYDERRLANVSKAVPDALMPAPRYGIAVPALA
jgi:hypothetical protein